MCKCDPRKRTPFCGKTDCQVPPQKVQPLDEETENEMIAEQIKLLFGFMSTLIPHKEKIKKISEYASGRAHDAAALAVLMPMDYEVKEKENQRVARRGELLYSLLCTLEETDREVEKARKESDGRKNMAKVLGF